ncbi:MAG: cyclase family protein [Proteobacteria bacterium]|nr:cyclase family protein [Pseudomonadota bacterium]
MALQNILNPPLPFTLIDLTHTLTPEIPSWNGTCGFHSDIKLDYEDCSTDVKFRVQQFKLHAGIGTHIDAPAHCVKEGLTVDELPLTELASPCVVIDVSSKAHETYQVTSLDILSFENKYGVLPPHAFVMIYTGWGRFWKDPEAYRNNLLFPSVSMEAASLLFDRNVRGLGIDTLSPDCPQSGFPVHRLLLGSGKYIVENIKNASKMPPIGGYSLALPIKIQGGTEAPIRLVGLLSKSINNEKIP